MNKAKPMKGVRVEETRNRPFFAFLCAFGLSVLAIGASERPPETRWMTNQPVITKGVLFSPDGLVLFANDGSALPIKLYNSNTGEFIKGFPYARPQLPESVYSLAVAADGQRLFSGNGYFVDAAVGYVAVWDVSKGTLIKTWIADSALVFSVALSPDGATLASGGTGYFPGARIKLWQLSDESNINTLEGHTGDINSVSFSPDGKWLASGSSDATVRLWPMPEGTPARVLSKHTDRVQAVVFSPDGKQLISASHDKTMRLWSVEDGALLRTFLGHTSGVNAVAISPDGRTLLSGAADETIKFWRLSDGKLLQTFNANFVVTSIAISPNGKSFAYATWEGKIAVAWMPLWITEIIRNCNDITLKWQGGGGRYQLQKLRSLKEGQWENVGEPTTETNATQTILAETTFYRVQSLQQ